MQIPGQSPALRDRSLNDMGAGLPDRTQVTAQNSLQTRVFERRPARHQGNFDAHRIHVPGFVDRQHRSDVTFTFGNGIDKAARFTYGNVHRLHPPPK